MKRKQTKAATYEQPSLAEIQERLFCGVRPTGLVWCDKSKEVDGDYMRLAFLSFDTLELTIDKANSPLMPDVIRQAEAVQARKGEQYGTSGSGQTITLGYKLPGVKP